MEALRAFLMTVNAHLATEEQLDGLARHDVDSVNILRATADECKCVALLYLLHHLIA
jgi:hypothetical protein